jgi:hypothetical protein
MGNVGKSGKPPKDVTIFACRYIPLVTSSSASSPGLLPLTLSSLSDRQQLAQQQQSAAAYWATASSGSHHTDSGSRGGWGRGIGVS